MLTFTVIATWREPVSGWIDNLYGPTGVVVGAGTGVLRTLHCDKDIVADMVPVDMCVAGLIAVAWATARDYDKLKASIQESPVPLIKSITNRSVHISFPKSHHT